jgi:tetratricopeptide (TPR) repeat protein
MPVFHQAIFRHAKYYESIGRKCQALYLEGKSGMSQALGLFDSEKMQIEAAMDNLIKFLEVLGVQISEPSSNNSRFDGQAPDQSKITAAATFYISLISTVMPNLGYLRFHPRQRIRWLQMQFSCAHAKGDLIEKIVASRQLGIAYWNLGDANGAIGFHKISLEVSRETGNRHGEAAALGNLGIAYSELGKNVEAIEFYGLALEIETAIGDKRGRANALGNIGIAHTELGNPRIAIGFHEQALSIDREIGDRQAEAMDLGNLGSSYNAIGQPEMAIRFCQDAIEISRQIGDSRSQASDLFTCALAFEKLADLNKAISHAKTALQIYDELEDPKSRQVSAQLSKWLGLRD